jgi:hypothetical protein
VRQEQHGKKKEKFTAQAFFKDDVILCELVGLVMIMEEVGDRGKFLKIERYKNFKGLQLLKNPKIKIFF